MIVSNVYRLALVALAMAYLLLGAIAEPHPHTGKIAPFKSGDPGVKLDNRALNILNSGKQYQTQIQSGTSGRGMVVQDVKAPVDVVWGRILDFDNYDKMVPRTYESKIYQREKTRHGEKICVKMKIGLPIFKITFYVKHLYEPLRNSMTWTLDYTIKSDLDDSCGYWYVIPHPENHLMSRVYYSVQVAMHPWFPQAIVDIMSKQALTDAVRILLFNVQQ